MSRKTKRKQRDRRRDIRQGDLRSMEETMDKMMVLACIMIEAAGTIDRAERLGMFEGLGPDVIVILKQIVPRSRGGEGAVENAELAWGQLLMDVMSTPEGRQAVAKTRRMYEKMENEGRPQTKDRLTSDENVSTKHER